MRGRAKRRWSWLFLLAGVVGACGGGGGGGPDAAVVNLQCDDPAVLDPVRAAVAQQPDGAFAAPAADHRAHLLAAIDQAAAAVSAGPAEAASTAIHDLIDPAVQADVTNDAARAAILAAADVAARSLTSPAIACPSQVTVSCVPPSGKAIAFGAAAADCQDRDPGPAITCSPASGSIVLPGETSGTCTATDSDGHDTSCVFPIHAVPDGVPVLDCAAPVSAACTGATTAVDVPQPGVDESCGTATSVTSDAPAGGFPVGETHVTFTATGTGGSDDCQTLVTVTDTSAPSISCEPALTVVRTSPDDPASVPLPTASDDCNPAPTVTYAPAVLPHGTTTVTFTATDDPAGLSSTCTTTVSVLDAFAVDGFRIASATLSGADTSVTLAWNRTFAADATNYRVERAADPAGPWTALGTVTVGTQIYTDAAIPGPSYYRVITLAGSLDGGVAGPLRALPIAADAYDLRSQTVPGVGFLTTLYGVIRHPADLSLGPFPLVVMLHGNHGICRSSPTNDICATSNDHDCPFAGYTTTPNAEGMVYLAETLAAQGYVAVTISGNAMNCRNDYIQERGYLIEEHLRRWLTWATTGGSPFGATYAGHVDMTRVGLVGHSRGGEAVSIVPQQLAVSPIAGVTIASIFAVAPTDYHGPTPVGAPYAVLLPACDGDVSTLAGMHIYDRSLSPADAVARSQVLFSRANHNFFSTEWRNDDNGDGFICDVSDEIGDVAQQAMLETTLGSWFNSTIGGTALEGFVTADAPTPLGISAWAGADLDLRWSHAAAVRAAIDSFEGAGTPSVNLLGGANTFTGFTSAARCTSTGCDGEFEHDKAAERLHWSGSSGTATIGLNGLDAGGAYALSFRVVSQDDPLNPVTAQDFHIEVTDSAGHVAEVLLTDEQMVPFLYPSNVPREVLQTVRIPLADLVALTPALELASLASLTLTMDVPGHASGAVLVTDFELDQ